MNDVDPDLLRRLRRAVRSAVEASPELKRQRASRLGFLRRIQVRLGWVLPAVLVLFQVRATLLSERLTLEGKLGVLALGCLLAAACLSVLLRRHLDEPTALFLFAHLPAPEDWVFRRQWKRALRACLKAAGLSGVILLAVLWPWGSGAGFWPGLLAFAAIQMSLLAVLSLWLERRGAGWVLLVCIPLVVLAWVGTRFIPGFTDRLIASANAAGELLGWILPTGWAIQPFLAVWTGVGDPQWWRLLPAVAVLGTWPWAYRVQAREFSFRDRILLETYGEPPLDLDEELRARIEQARERPSQPGVTEITDRILDRGFLEPGFRAPTGWIERSVWAWMSDRERLLLAWTQGGLPAWTAGWFKALPWLFSAFTFGTWLRYERPDEVWHYLVWLGGFVLAGFRFLPQFVVLGEMPYRLLPILPDEESWIQWKASVVRALFGLPLAVAFGAAAGWVEPALGIGRGAWLGLNWALLASQVHGVSLANRYAEGFRAAPWLRRTLVSFVLLGIALLVLAALAASALAPMAWAWIPGLLACAGPWLMQKLLIWRVNRNRCDLESTTAPAG